MHLSQIGLVIHFPKAIGDRLFVLFKPRINFNFPFSCPLITNLFWRQVRAFQIRVWSKEAHFIIFVLLTEFYYPRSGKTAWPIKFINRIWLKHDCLMQPAPEFLSFKLYSSVIVKLWPLGRLPIPLPCLPIQLNKWFEVIWSKPRKFKDVRWPEVSRNWWSHPELPEVPRSPGSKI